MIQSHPNEMFCEGTGEEMFTLQPAMPNLNANYGNFVEEASAMSNETAPMIPPFKVGDGREDPEDDDESAVKLSKTFEHTEAMRANVYHCKRPNSCKKS